MGRVQNFMLYTVKESHTVFLRDVNFNIFVDNVYTTKI